MIRRLPFVNISRYVRLCTLLLCVLQPRISFCISSHYWIKPQQVTVKGAHSQATSYLEEVQRILSGHHLWAAGRRRPISRRVESFPSQG